MRSYSNNVATILALQDISYFYLVELGPYLNLSWVSTTKRYITLGVDKTIGGNLYSGNSKIISVDPPRMSSSVDRESYKITLVDPDYEFRGLFERGFSQINVKISIGFFNTSPGVLGGVAPGEPILSISDTIVVYAGKVDNQVYAVDMDDGGVLCTLECTSPMGAIAMSRPRLTTNDSIQQINPADTSFSQVYKGSKGVGLLWGKKP
jgi:hypothetical protein